jgi:hypothetical protein
MKHKIHKLLTIVPETQQGNDIVSVPGVQRMAWCYLHGDLTNICDYDIFGIQGELPKYAGIYPAEVLTSHVSSTEATFFLWVGHDGMARGIVAANADVKSMDYAQKLYAEKPLAF